MKKTTKIALATTVLAFATLGLYMRTSPEEGFAPVATDKGIVLNYGQAPNGSDALGARDVFVWQSGGKYYMTYDGESTTGWGANEATSTDMIHWNRLGRVLDKGAPGQPDESSADYGTTYFDGKHWYMFYLADKTDSGAPYFIPSGPYTMMTATSDSPTGPWVKKPGQTFDLKPGTYYEAETVPGTIVKQGDEYLMFFTAGSSLGENMGIARAKSLDGPWTPDAKPLFSSPISSENPSVYYQKSTKTWFMFVNHINREKGYTDAVDMYWSQDIKHWNVQNKTRVIDGSNSFSKTVIGAPSVIQKNDKLYVYYDGKTQTHMNAPIDHMYRSIGVATLQLPIKTQ